LANPTTYRKGTLMARQVQGKVIKKLPGYGASLSWITVRWTDENGNAHQEEVACGSQVDYYSIGDTVTITKKLIGWELV
jgi:hypothetical protein